MRLLIENLFNRKEVEVEEMPEPIQLKAGQSYMALVNEELNTKTAAPIEAEIIRLRKAQEEARAMWFKKNPGGVPVIRGQVQLPDHDDEIIKTMGLIKARLEAKEKELRETRYKCQPDLGLMSLARQLDRLGSHQVAARLFSQFAKTVNEQMDILNKIERLYRGQYYAPQNFGRLQEVLREMISALNQVGIPTYDRKELEAQFADRLAMLRQQRVDQDDRLTKLRSLID
ncbi:MAG: hypothetical protein PHT79_06630 [Syntrophomonadaceae bacterium]|nr:hypothetical protein [Syntrophomonadaceae bacterium]MDD4549419.1 hypothetical protein [Syntrophomonadaceae bacterium]